MVQEIPSEINDHLNIFGNNADEVDYNSIGPCPLCGSRVDEFNFCACGGNMGCDWPFPNQKPIKNQEPRLVKALQ
jgi:hypothetical protein